jgi:hypothetical protein
MRRKFTCACAAHCGCIVTRVCRANNQRGELEMTQDFAEEFAGLPTYFVTNTRTEAFGHNVRVYHWEKRGSILAPQFIAVVPAPELVVINRDIREAVSRILLGGPPDVGASAH